jgi:predicted Zn-dependent protease
MRGRKNEATIGSWICSGSAPTLLLALCLLAACAPQPVYPPPPPEPEAPAPEPPEPLPPEEPEPLPEEAPPPRTVEEVSGPAVLALLSHAQTQADSGELDRAAASVERALDVEPRNPFLYHRLAILRLNQDQPGQAEALARKSNSLAGDNPYLQTRNWELIAQSRYMRGDALGADSAAARAEHYRSRRPE